MKLHLTAFAGGIAFAVGLGLAGMTLPEKIIGFLDFFGDWDPTLMFVMGGAVATYFLLMKVVQKVPRPLFADRFRIPTRRDIDVRLIAGAAMFGAGWGLGGYCPGPGLTSVGAGQLPALAFVASMIAGMLAYREIERRRVPADERTPVEARVDTSRTVSTSS